MERSSLQEFGNDGGADTGWWLGREEKFELLDQELEFLKAFSTATSCI
jgi:hypothetical protein